MTDFDLCLSCSDGINTLTRFATFKHDSVFHGKSFKRFEIETGDRDHGSGCIAQLASCNKNLLQMDKCRSVTARSEMGDADGICVSTYCKSHLEIYRSAVEHVDRLLKNPKYSSPDPQVTSWVKSPTKRGMREV